MDLVHDPKSDTRFLQGIPQPIHSRRKNSHSLYVPYLILHPPPDLPYSSHLPSLAPALPNTPP